MFTEVISQVSGTNSNFPRKFELRKMQRKSRMCVFTADWLVLFFRHFASSILVMLNRCTNRCTLGIFNEQHVTSFPHLCIFFIVYFIFIVLLFIWSLNCSY